MSGLVGQRAYGEVECPVCHQSGASPGHDSLACWLCAGGGWVNPEVPSSKGLFLRWLMRKLAS